MCRFMLLFLSRIRWWQIGHSPPSSGIPFSLTAAKSGCVLRTWRYMSFLVEYALSQGGRPCTVGASLAAHGM